MYFEEDSKSSSKKSISPYNQDTQTDNLTQTQNRQYHYQRADTKKKTTQQFQQENYDQNLLNLKTEESRKKTQKIDQIAQLIRENEKKSELLKQNKISKIRQSNFHHFADHYEEDEEDLMVSKNIEEMKKRLKQHQKQQSIVQKTQDFMKRKKLVPQSKDQKFNQLISGFNTQGEDYFLDLQTHLKNLNIVNCQYEFKELENLKDTLKIQNQEKQAHLQKKQFKLDKDFLKECQINTDLIELTRLMQKKHKGQDQDKKYFEKKKNNGLTIMNQLISASIQKENEDKTTKIAQQTEINDNEDFYKIMNEKIQQKNKFQKDKQKSPRNKYKQNKIRNQIPSKENKEQVTLTQIEENQSLIINNNNFSIDAEKNKNQPRSINLNESIFIQENDNQQVEQKQQEQMQQIQAGKKLKDELKLQQIKKKGRLSENANYEQFMENNIEQTDEKIKKLENQVLEKYKVFGVIMDKSKYKKLDELVTNSKSAQNNKNYLQEYEGKANLFRKQVKKLNIGTLEHKYKLCQYEERQKKKKDQEELNKLFQQANKFKKDINYQKNLKDNKFNFSSSHQQLNEKYNSNIRMTDSYKQKWRKRTYIQSDNDDHKYQYSEQNANEDSFQSSSQNSNPNLQQQNYSPQIFFTQNKNQEEQLEQINLDEQVSTKKFSRFLNDDSKSEIIEQQSEESDGMQNSDNSYQNIIRKRKQTMGQRINRNSYNQNLDTNNNINSYFNILSNGKINETDNFNQNNKSKGYVTHYNGITSFYASINPSKKNLSTKHLKSSQNNESMKRSRKSLSRKSLAFQSNGNNRLSLTLNCNNISNNFQNNVNSKTHIDQQYSSRSLQGFDNQGLNKSQQDIVQNKILPFQMQQMQDKINYDLEKIKKYDSKYTKQIQEKYAQLSLQSVKKSLLKGTNLNSTVNNSTRFPKFEYNQSTKKLTNFTKRPVNLQKKEQLASSKSPSKSINNLREIKQSQEKNKTENKSNTSTKSLPKLNFNPIESNTSRRKTKLDIQNDMIRFEQNQIKSKDNRSKLINLMHEIDLQRKVNFDQALEINDEEKKLNKQQNEFLKKYDLIENEAGKFRYLMDYKEKEKKLQQAMAMMSQQDKKLFEQEAKNILQSESLQFQKLKENILSSKSMQMAMRQSIRKKKK